MIDEDDHEDESTKWIILYSDRVDVKRKNAIMAHGILKLLGVSFDYH